MEIENGSVIMIKQCKDCIYYIESYCDDFTVKHFNYGKVKSRPACSFGNSYGFVSNNPATFCRWYEKKKELKTKEQIKQRLAELEEMQNNLPWNSTEWSKLQSGINELLWVLDEPDKQIIHEFKTSAGLYKLEPEAQKVFDDIEKTGDIQKIIMSRKFFNKITNNFKTNRIILMNDIEVEIKDDLQADYILMR